MDGMHRGPLDNHHCARCHRPFTRDIRGFYVGPGPTLKVNVYLCCACLSDVDTLAEPVNLRPVALETLAARRMPVPS
jgi:hypothetical protein